MKKKKWSASEVWLKAIIKYEKENAEALKKMFKPAYEKLWADFLKEHKIKSN
jgi:hypothetical protein